MVEDSYEGWKTSQNILAAIAEVAAGKADNFVNYKLGLNREEIGSGDIIFCRNMMGRGEQQSK